MVQTVNGEFHGSEMGQFTNTLLSIMWKSVAGKYWDIFAIRPVTNINAGILFEVWNNPVSVVTNIALDAILTMADAHLKNMSFFNSYLLKNV